MPLFVVMTNLPGPGAAALLDEIPRDREAGDGWKRDAQGVVWVAVPQAKASVNGASEFVELENERGAGVGPSSGVTWHTESSFLSDKTVVKLGPFAPCDSAAIERGAEAIDDLLQQLGVDPGYAPEHDATGTVKRILARAVLDAAAKVSAA